MKKLFFAAALALVAIGGAFATSSNFAPIYYAPGSTTPVDCAPGSILCSAKLGSTTAFTTPAPNQSNPITLTQLNTAKP